MGLWMDNWQSRAVAVLEGDVSVWWGEEVQPVVWDEVVATCTKGEVLLTEILELDVWAAVACDMVAQKSKWMVCRRSLQWR